LTDEEEEIKQGLIKKYFGDATEKQIFIKGMVEMGEIRKEEAWELLEELTNMKGNNFMLFLGELQDKIGCQVVRGTLVERKCVEKKEF
jgi:polyhydroxyalkanoate synthesis regulator phasin